MLVIIDGNRYQIVPKKGQIQECSDDYILGLLKGIDVSTEYLGRFEDVDILLECVQTALPSYMEIIEFEDAGIFYEFQN